MSEQRKKHVQSWASETEVGEIPAWRGSPWADKMERARSSLCQGPGLCPGLGSVTQRGGNHSSGRKAPDESAPQGGEAGGSLSHLPSGEGGMLPRRGLQCSGKDSGQITARAVRGLWLPSHLYRG